MNKKREHCFRGRWHRWSSEAFFLERVIDPVNSLPPSDDDDDDNDDDDDDDDNDDDDDDGGGGDEKEEEEGEY